MPVSPKNTVLVLGGTGTVGKRIAQQLATTSHPALIASRSGSGANGVVFDWLDTDTWVNPFAAATDIRRGISSTGSGSGTGSGSSGSEAGDGVIRSVYLIAPPEVPEPASMMMEFINFARERGVRRFVLQSASCIEPGGPLMGKVHAYLREMGQRGELDWAVLRPTWLQREFFSSLTMLVL